MLRPVDIQMLGLMLTNMSKLLAYAGDGDMFPK